MAKSPSDFVAFCALGSPDALNRLVSQTLSATISDGDALVEVAFFAF